MQEIRQNIEKYTSNVNQFVTRVIPDKLLRIKLFQRTFGCRRFVGFAHLRSGLEESLAPPLGGASGVDFSLNLTYIGKQILQ